MSHEKLDQHYDNHEHVFMRALLQEALDISSRETEKANEESEILLNEQAEEFESQLEKAKEEISSLETERDTLSSQLFVLEEQVSHESPLLALLLFLL